MSAISIENIKGIGPSRKKLLNKLGIFNAVDILEWYPREYEDRRHITSIKMLRVGDKAVFKARVMTKIQETRVRNNLMIQKVKVKDDSGHVTLVWFNRTYLKRLMMTGQSFIFYGTVKAGYEGIEVHNCEFEGVRQTAEQNSDRILPIYSLTNGISQKVMRKIVRNTLEYRNSFIEEVLPEQIMKEYKLCDKKYALEYIHFPNNEQSVKEASYRLIFEELFFFQISLVAMRNKLRTVEKGIEHINTEKIQTFIGELPFELTPAQKRVFNEIKHDMESSVVMNRIIHGDVGSGKTIIAVLCMLKAFYSGYQSALMVPSEVLAEQHYRTFTALLNKTGVKIVLLTGSVKGNARKAVLDMIERKEAAVIIGTHALIQEGVKYNCLGLVVTDEQHRFGVRQRALLSCKGQNPDMLVMTATPIPRTLALTLYGDLDVSCIDERPDGRKGIKTYVVNESMRSRINEFIIKEVKKGRQAFIVCPLIEESEYLDITSAEEYYNKTSKNEFKNLKMCLIHGNIKSSEIDEKMRQFVSGDIDVLVATTVIEVGVDVPNASVIVIENAERFGLAQLHQLRGRVGRGSEQSYCILFNQSKTDISQKRMKVIQGTDNGFIISEKDLELRGPGEFYGVRQHGVPFLKIADIYRDKNILNIAREAAEQIISEDELLENENNMVIRKHIDSMFENSINEIAKN